MSKVGFLNETTSFFFTFFFQDIFENDDIKLDSMFIVSLVKDLVRVSIKLKSCGIDSLHLLVELSYGGHKNTQSSQLSFVKHIVYNKEKKHRLYFVKVYLAGH